MLLPVLAWSSSILGVFITYTFMTNPSSGSQHNIGCYVVPHYLNHSAELYTRIEVAKNQLAPVAYQHRELITDEKQFDKNMMKVAQGFEKYLQQLTQDQTSRLKDSQIVKAIRDAQKQYLTCKVQIQGIVDGGLCNVTWSSYLNCFDDVKKIHDKLDGLILTKQQIQDSISNQLRIPQNDNTKTPEYLAEQIYNDSIKANDAALQQLKDSLTQTQRKLEKAKDSKYGNQDKMLLKEQTYRQCWQNRRIYKHCQQISEQVNSISNELVQQLKQQLQAKTRLMQHMRDMMIRMGHNENRKMSEHWNQIFKKHREEYKQMYVDYIYNTRLEIKACGCTQQEEKLLKAEVEEERKLVVKYQLQIDQLSGRIENIKGLILQRQQERDKIVADYQRALKDKTLKPDIIQSSLTILKRRIQVNANDIMNMQDDFNNLDRQCKAIKATLAVSIRNIDKVEDCIGKKEYLMRLRAETSKHLNPQRKSLTKLYATKRELGEAVAAIGQL